MKSKQSLLGAVLAITLVFTVAGAPLWPQPAHASYEDAAIFYDELSQHGSWVDYEQYGPVWYPGQVEQDWRPYSNGRWVPSEQGYLFETNEPWGWATYHYGNWMPTENYGWVWAPGRTWYPNTVAWRNSPESASVDTSYIGWAPLPPPNYAPPPAYAPTGYAPPPPGYYGGGGGYPGGGGVLDLLGAPFWIFAQASRFLLGFGQPYTPAYSYYGCGCLAPPTYYPTIYPATALLSNWYYPSYYQPSFFGGAAALGAYGWGPPTAYVSRVTNINHVTINNYINNVNVNRVRGGWPDNVVFNRNPNLRKIMPTDNPAAFSRVKPMQVRNVDQAARHLGNPRAIVQPAGLKPLETGRIPKATVTAARQVSPDQPMKMRGMGLPGRAQQQVTPQMAERMKNLPPAGAQGAAGRGRGMGGPQQGIVGGPQDQRGRRVGPGEGPGMRRGPVTQEGFQQPGGVRRGPGEGPGQRRGPVTQEGQAQPGGVRRGPGEGPGMRRGPVEGVQGPGSQGVRRGPGEGPDTSRGMRRGPAEGVQGPGQTGRGRQEGFQGPGQTGRGRQEGVQQQDQQRRQQQQQQMRQQQQQQDQQRRGQQQQQEQQRRQQQQQQMRQQQDQQRRQQQEQQQRQQQQQQIRQQQQQQQQQKRQQQEQDRRQKMRQQQEQSQRLQMRQQQEQSRRQQPRQPETVRSRQANTQKVDRRQQRSGNQSAASQSFRER